MFDPREQAGVTLEATFGTRTPVVGMVHLLPLPGAPTADGDLSSAVDRAVNDARALESGGADGILVENYGDVPFYPDDVPKHVVASMTRIATTVADETALPLGVNVLRNDAEAAVSVANAVDGDFVRVNVHAGARVTDQGIVQGHAHRTLRLDDRLDAGVDVFADVDVKHSRPLGGRSNDGQSFVDLVERGLADAVVVSGRGTGSVVDAEHLRRVALTREEHGLETPIVVGSGVRAENVSEVLSIADGAIVGTALKEGEETTNPVDPERVATLVNAVRD